MIIFMIFQPSFLYKSYRISLYIKREKSISTVANEKSIGRRKVIAE